MERSPSLADRLATWLRGGPARPAGYLPALAVLAAIPAATALLASGFALREEHRAAGLARAGAADLALRTLERRDAARRAAMAPYLAAPTLTGELGEIVASLPAEAVLHAIARDAGTLRIEVDCPDPDALLRGLRAQPSRRGWRSVAQSVVEGSGVRVTLEAAR